MSKLWGGRFSKDVHPEVASFTTSLIEDRRLWDVDIRASLAHARMLGAQGIIAENESQSICAGLEWLHSQFKAGDVQLQASAEDIHSEVERMLTEKIGAVAGKLHTARSRNDQVVTDVRLYTREAIDQLQSEVSALSARLLELAEQNIEAIMPGLTHMQHAQPVSLAHHLLAYFWMFSRDLERLKEVRKRVNRLPLGAAALAGTSFPIDREMVARELQFEGVIENSLDAVSDRDFAVETVQAFSLVQLHLSKLADELVLWSMPEFAYVTLDDSVTTGSSIMPQKKNPDVAELVRGKTGRVFASWTGLMTTLKALPLAYNRDFQEDKHHLFMAIDTTTACTRMTSLMLAEIQFHPEAMRAKLAGDFANATDLADALAKSGVPFREAHEIIGRIVKACLAKGQPLESMTLEELRMFHPAFTEEAVRTLSHMSVMQARHSQGGTSTTAVRAQLKLANESLKSLPL